MKEIRWASVFAWLWFLLGLFYSATGLAYHDDHEVLLSCSYFLAAITAVLLYHLMQKRGKS